MTRITYNTEHYSFTIDKPTSEVPYFVRFLETNGATVVRISTLTAHGPRFIL